MRRTTTLIAALAGGATLTLTALEAGAATPEYLAVQENGGIHMLGRTRNESCSVTTTFKSADGQAHQVTVNQTPKWGPATVTVPAGGQVTVVVNGDITTPYLVTVDGTVELIRPVPTVTPGGVDCGPVATTTVPPTTTTTFTPPELETVTVDDPLPTPTLPPTTTTVPPTTTIQPPYVPLADPPQLPETGAGTGLLIGAGSTLLAAGVALTLTARKARR